MRGRGLKRQRWLGHLRAAMSPPMRGRGLKPLDLCHGDLEVLVAPHAGAWIETGLIRGWRPFLPVAPHAGAWIETTLLAIQSLGS